MVTIAPQGPVLPGNRVMIGDLGDRQTGWSWFPEQPLCVRHHADPKGHILGRPDDTCKKVHLVSLVFR